MSERPYHHGNLRVTLLAAAEHTLREEGLDQVSLRALARAAGVSHAAPRRHFPDRQALLGALAADGYERLADTLAAAIEQAGPDFEAQFQAGGTAFVRFAVDNAALLDLMFASRPAAAKGAPERPYLIVGEMVRRGQESGRLAPGDPGHLRLLVLAMLQGIAELITSRRVPAGQAEDLVAAAAALFIRS
jgi:AcrR family transcriptional regulator